VSSGALLSLVFCLAVLTLRFLLSRRLPRQPRSLRQRMEFSRILLGALLALAAIAYLLQRQAARLEGGPEYERSLLERLVLTLAGK
jgi:hypothetical protein